MRKFATWLAYFVITILFAMCVFLIITVVSDESVSAAQRVIAFMHGFIDCCLLGVIVAKWTDEKFKEEEQSLVSEEKKALQKQCEENKKNLLNLKWEMHEWSQQVIEEIKKEIRK